MKINTHYFSQHIKKYRRLTKSEQRKVDRQIEHFGALYNFAPTARQAKQVIQERLNYLEQNRISETIYGFFTEIYEVEIHAEGKSKEEQDAALQQALAEHRAGKSVALYTSNLSSQNDK